MNMQSEQASVGNKLQFDILVYAVNGFEERL